MHRLVLVFALALGISFAGLRVLAPDAAGQEPKPGVSLELKAAVKVLVHRLATKRDGLRIGIPVAEAVKALPGATNILGSYDASLAETEYAPGPGEQGVLSFYLSDDDKRLDGIRILLLAKGYDRKELGDYLLRVAEAAGFEEFTPDDDTPHLYWGSIPESDHGDPGRGPVPGRDLWVSLGTDLIVFESGI